MQKPDPANVLPLSAPPLYEQIKTALRARILDGTYAAHRRCRPKTICARCSTSAASPCGKRSAICRKKALLFKLHGKGTFVSKPKAFQNVSALQGFAEAMSSMGYEIVNQLKHIRFIPADRADRQPP